jgi:hypothetical protein
VTNIFGALNPSSFLNYGAIGVGFGLAVLSFRLLSAEQNRQNARTKILVSTFVFMTLSLVLTGFGFLSEHEKRLTDAEDSRLKLATENVNFRVVATIEGTDPNDADDPIRMEVCAGPWSLEVEGENVNQEVHANLNDFRVRIIAPGYSGGTNIPISRVKMKGLNPGPVFVDDGIARLGTFTLRKKLSPPPVKDFAATSGVKP